MNKRTAAALLGITACLVAGGEAAAKRRDNTPTAQPAAVDRLLACRSIADGSARLACFDRETAVVAEAVSKKDLVVVDREGVRDTKRKLFGFSVPSLGGVFGGGDDEVKQVEGKVAAVGGNRDGGLFLVLEDGARWSQNDGKVLAVAPRRGDKVIIKHGALGSYLMSIAGQPSIKVVRVN